MNKQLPQGVVNIRGKEYQTVALRVFNFRESYPQYSLVTEVLHRDVDCVVMKATISNDAGRVVATGHAEEYRKSSEINKTSALENAETSAIGRALAALGIGGTEFASADEVARAISGEKGEARETERDPFASFTPHAAKTIRAVAASAIEHFSQGDEIGAFEEVLGCVEKLGGDDNQRRNDVMSALAVPFKPHSALRAMLKEQFQKMHRAEAAA